MSLPTKSGKTNISTNGYVTIGQAAAYLGVSIDTIRRWERSGKLQAQRLDGKNRYFAIDDLQTFKSSKPLTTSQVAVLLSVSESTVRRLEREGQLTASRDGNGKRLYDSQDVSQYSSQRAAKSSVAQSVSAADGAQQTAVADASQLSSSEAVEPQTAGPVAEQQPVQSLADTDAKAVTHRGSRGWYFGQRAFGAALLLAVLLLMGVSWHYSVGRKSDKNLSNLSDSSRILGAGDLQGSNQGINQGGNQASNQASNGSGNQGQQITSSLNLPSTFFLNLPQAGLTVDITTPNIQGRAIASLDFAKLPVTSDEIADNAITNQQIAPGGITYDSLSPDLQSLIGSGGSSGPVTKVTNQYTTNDYTVSVLAGLGLNSTDGTNSVTLDVRTGQTTTLSSNNLEVALSGGVVTSTTSSGSGLEATSQGLQLLGGCGTNQVLQWTGAAWACATVSTGSSNLAIDEAGSLKVNNPPAIDFAGNDFNVTNSGGNAAVAIDYANSGIAVVSSAEAITGNWSFKDSGFTIKDDIDGTKQANFQLSGITTGTTRTLTVPNASGTLVTTGNLNNITSVGTVTAGVWQGTAVGVQYGGTGAATFTSNGVIYGNGTGALQATTAGTSGQLLIANGSGVPTFVSLSGDITVTNAGVTTIGAGKVTNADLVNNSVTVTAGNGLSGGGAVSLGGSTSLTVAYGSAANTAVQGSTTLTCASGTGNLSGGGNTITLGTGGSCNNLTISNSPTFTGLVTSVGLNAGAGTIQNSSGGLAVSGNSTIAGTLGSLTGLTSSGTVTFSGLNAAGIVTNTAAGVLGTTATIPVANGGTNLSSYTTGDLLYASAATTIGKLNDVATGSCLLSGGVGVAPAWGSCAAGGGITGSGIANYVARFNTGSTLNTGQLYDDGSLVSVGGTSPSALFNVGATNQFQVSSAGAVTAVGLNGGTGLIQGTGGLNVSGSVTFGSLNSAGVVHTNGSGVLSTGAVANGDLANSSVTINNGTNVSGGGAVSLGGNLTLGVINNPTFSGLITGQAGLSVTGATTLSSLNSAGVVHTNASGVLSTGAVANGDLANSSVTVTAGNGLGGGGAVSLGGSASLSVTYGSAANTAVQGSVTLTCPSGTGNLSGGGDVITLGTGGSCSNLSITNSPTFSGTLAVQGASVTVGAAAQQGSLILNDGNGASNKTGTIQAFATLGQNTTYTLPDPGAATATICLSTGNCSAVGTAGGDLTGTYPNPTIAAGVVTGAKIANNTITNTNILSGSFGNITGVGTLAGLTASGVITFSGLNSAGVVHTNASGVLSTGAVANGDLANSGITINNGTNVTGGSAVSLGGNVTLGVINNPTFSGLITGQAGLTVTGSTTLSSLNSAGVVHTNGSGVLSTGAVALGTDTSGSYVANLGSLTGLTTSGNSGAASTPTLSVTYGSAASTAAEGNTALTFNGSGNLTGNLSGTAGGGFSTTTLAVVSNPSFSGLLTASQSGANALAVTGTPLAGASGATSSLIQFGPNAISGGNNTATTGGTYLGLNAPSSGAGSTADFINFESNNASKFRVDATGALTATSFTGNGSALTNLAGGNVTAGSIANSALANSSITINNGTNVTGGGSAVSLGGNVTLGVINNPTFSGLITGQASLAVTGNSTIAGTLSSLTGLTLASGNISGATTITGGTINATTNFQANGTAGVGSTCGAGQANTNATFSQGILTSAGSCTTVQAAGNYLVQAPTTTAANTIAPTTNSVVGLTVKGTTGTAAHVLDIYNANAAPTLQSYFDQNGALNTAQAITVTAGGVAVTGNSSIAGTLTGLTGLTIASGGASITGNSTIAGTLGSLTGLTLASGNISGATTITGGTINATTNFQANGTAGVGVACGANQANLNATWTEGILTSAGTCTTVQAAGNYLVQAPTTTAANTIAPTTNSVVGLTVKGTTGTAAHVLDIYNANAAPTLQSYFDQNGALNTAQAITVSANGIAVTGNSTIAGTLGSLTGLTLASGNISGATTITGGTINATTNFQANGTAGVGVACGAGQSNLNATWTEGILTSAGTCTTVQAAGSYLVQAPTTTAANTIAPTTNSVVGLTVKGTTGTAAHVLDIYNANAAPTLQSYFDQNGALNTAQAITVTAGGIAVTGNSTITGTLGGLTGLTVASGGASITGNTTIAGTLGSLTGYTQASGTFSQTYTTAAATSAHAISVTSTNAGAGVAVQGVDLTPNLSGTPSSGNNTLNVVNFNAGGTATAGNRITNGLNFASATGYTNFINTPSAVLTSAGAFTGLTGVTLASGNISGATTITGGTINATTNFQANGTAGVGVACGAGQSNLNATWTEGILTSAGTCTTVQAAGNYLVQAPTTTAANTIAPTTASVVGLTVKGTTSTAAHVLDIYNSNAAPTLQSYFDQNGALNTGQAITVTAGGIAVTGNSTVTGTLGGLTGLTVASGGASITGNSTISGTLGSLTGLTLASGSISAPTSNTINSLGINAGALTGVTGVTFTSGAIALNSGGITAAGTIAGVTGYTQSSGSFSQTYTTAAATSAHSISVTSTNAGAGVAVQGIDLTPNLSGTPSSGNNTLNVINFNAGGTAVAGNRISNGLNFASATGYTNFISTPTAILSSGGAFTGLTGVTLASGNISGATTITGGTINATTNFQANGTAGVGVACGANQANLNATWTEGILTSAGTCTTVQAAGNYLVQAPTTTAANTIAPTTNSVVGLTVKGTTGTAAHVLDIYNANAAPTLQSYFDQNGALNTAQVITVSAGGIAVTGNSTITGTLGGLTGLTVASGGASITGNSTISGTLGSLTGLTLASGTISAPTSSTINGININAGALSGISTIGLSGAITGATSGTINGININSGAISGVSTLGLSGAITGATSGTINGININSGAISGVSTLGLSGAITGATSNTINGLSISSGALSTVTGITFTSGALALNSGGITAAGSIAGVTTIAQSYSTAVAGSAHTLSITNTNAGAAIAVQGLDLTPNLSGTPSSGNNSLNVLNFNAGGTAVAANRITNGLNFASATGYTNFLSSPSINVTSAGALTGVTGITLTGTETHNLGATDQLAITSGTNVPTVDQLNITNTGSTGVTAAGINGLSIAYKGGAAAVEAAAQRIDLTPGTTSGGTWSALRVVPNATGAVSGVTENGIKLDNLTTPGSGTENAINVGTGWDNVLQSTNTTITQAGAFTTAGLATLNGGIASSGAISIDATGALNLGPTNTTSVVIGGNTAATITEKVANSSTTAYTLQTAGATAILTLDTTNSKLTVGATGGTPIILILANKNTSGDPTEVDGAMYYNSNIGTFRCGQGGAWRNCLGGGPSNASTATQAPSAGTDTYLTGSVIPLPTGGLRAPTGSAQDGSKITWRIIMSKTAAGVAASTFTIRVGTNGTTADTARCTAFSTGTSTAAVDWAVVTITAYATAGGSVSALNCSATLTHTLISTGWSNAAGVQAYSTQASFDTTPAGTKIGLSFNAGAATVTTVQSVDVTTSNL